MLTCKDLHLLPVQSSRTEWDQNALAKGRQDAESTPDWFILTKSLARTFFFPEMKSCNFFNTLNRFEKNVVRSLILKIIIIMIINFGKNNSDRLAGRLEGSLILNPEALRSNGSIWKIWLHVGVHSN